MVTFREILEDTPLGDRLNVILQESKTSWLRDLGKNDFQHSLSVEQILDRLVPEELKQNQDLFDHGEIFLLLVSIYLHDIGRKTTHHHHEIVAYDEIKKKPEKFFLKNIFEAEAVAQICAAHAPEDVWPILTCDDNFGIAGLTSAGKTFNLQLLGALLRIADELENTYLRVSGISSQQNSPRMLIRDINPIPTHGIIEIQAQPNTWKDWASLRYIREHCERRLREVTTQLEQIGLHYYQVWLRPRPEEFKAPLSIPIPVSAYHELVEQIALFVELKFDEVDIFTKIDDREISVLCSSNTLDLITKTAILAAPILTDDLALEFSGALVDLRERRRIDKALVVTGETRVSNSASKILKQSDIHTLTLNDLECRLFNFANPMEKYIRDYQDSLLFKRNLYIKSKGILEINPKAINVEQFILEWLKTPSSIHLTILGDYGSGKTTLANRITYVLAKEQKLRPYDSRIPIFIQLKTLRQAESIEAAITDVLVNSLNQELNFSVFDALNKHGRFVIILDGFDELKGLNNEDSVLRAFRQLDRLVCENAKIILTCRTHFFKDESQIHRMHEHEGSSLYHSIDSKYGYSLMYLLPFTDEQIEEYLIRWDCKNGRHYYKIIKSIYNLGDLAKRPVLLNLLAKTVPQINNTAVLEKTSQVDASSLYKIYINFWLARDDWRSPISKTERRTIAETIAEYLLVMKKTTIHYRDLPSLLPEWFAEVFKKYGHDILDVECRTCNFLVSDRAGNYGFAHESFQEFLLAYIFIRKLFEEKSEDISLEWFLPLESQTLKVGSKIVVSKETEIFSLQLAQARLATITPDLLFSIVHGRKRAELAIIYILKRLELFTYGIFFAKILLQSSTEFDASMSMLLRSYEPEKAIKDIIYSLDENSNLEFARKICDSLIDRISDENIKRLIFKLDEKIDELSYIEDEEDFSLELAQKEYPFSRAKRKEKLEELLEGCDDLDERKEKRHRFLREWERKKSEYDQKLQKKEREDVTTEGILAEKKIKSEKKKKRKKKNHPSLGKD